MAFSDYVSQIFGKRAVWLYRIVIPGVATYHVTSRGRNFTSSAGKPEATFLAAQVWTSTAILNSGVVQTTQSQRAEIDVSLPTTGEIAQALLAYRGEGEVSLSVWQTFAGDPDEEYARKFSGRVVSVQPGLLTVRLICEEGFTSMARSSAAQVMQRPCRHAHYFTYEDGGGCRLDVDDWKQAVVITAATGRVMTIPLAGLQPPGSFSAGLLFWGGNQYFIENHSGNQITLESVPIGLVTPASADIAPGCNLTPQNCIAFNNIANFGGFWFMTDTPFDGRALG